MSLTPELRYELIRLYFINGESVVSTRRAWVLHPLTRHLPAPSDHTIRNTVNRLRNLHTLEDAPRSGRPRSGEEVIERVRESVENDPRLSTRHRSLEVGVSRPTLIRILKEELLLHPYKIQTTMGLEPGDPAARLNFARRFINRVEQDPTFLHRLVISDEVHFELGGYVNRQNFRIWGTENPRVVIRNTLHPQKLTVWCGMTSTQIFGPYFFEEDGRRVTVNSERYSNMLEDFLLPIIGYESNLIFQQDGATPHTAVRSLEVLYSMFDELISRNTEFPWPPRSPDLSTCDFFLWGCIKDRVYRTPPRTLEDLRAAIIREIAAVPQEELQRAFQQMVTRATLLLEENGGYLQDVIFHT